MSGDGVVHVSHGHHTTAPVTGVWIARLLYLTEELSTDLLALTCLQGRVAGALELDASGKRIVFLACFKVED